MRAMSYDEISTCIDNSAGKPDDIATWFVVILFICEWDVCNVGTLGTPVE